MYKFFLIILSIFIIWQLFSYIKTHPEAISKENISRSFFSMGILALLLIFFIAGLVCLVRK